MADNREAIMFKQVPDGYVFRAPNPWVFGRARFYFANEAQKAQLLAIITARGAIVFWVAFVALIGVSTALLAYASGHDDPTVGDVVIMVVLLPVWVYAALLISVRPTARRLQPLLAGLSLTDQRITTDDLREATQKTISVGQYLLIGISQAMMAAAFIVMLFEKTHDGRVSVFEDGAAFANAFAAVAFVFSALCFLVAASSKARNKHAAYVNDDGILDERSPANRFFKSALLPILAFIVLSFVAMNAIENHNRDNKAALINSRLQGLKVRMNGSQIPSRQDSLKARIAANSGRVNELINKLNNPTVKCETAAATDDQSRIESIRNCGELARKEQDAIQSEMAAANKESEIIRLESAALRKEVEAVQTEINAIQAEIKANRR